MKMAGHHFIRENGGLYKMWSKIAGFSREKRNLHLFSTSVLRTLCWPAALSARPFGKKEPHHLCCVLFGSKAIMGADFANSRELSSVASIDLPVRILDNSRKAIGWRLA